MLLLGGLLLGTLISLASCSSGAPAETSTGASSPAGGSPTTGEPAAEIVVGVLQIVSHPALDATVEGFKEALAAAGYPEPRVRFVMKNAEGDEERARAMVEQLGDEPLDLLFTVSEPASRAADEALPQVPMVFAAVNDPVDAGLVSELRRPGGNVTGVSDMLPVEPHLSLLAQLLPGNGRVGVIYNPGERESRALVRAERRAAAQFGLITIEVSVSDASQVLGAAERLVGRVDAISVLSDATVVAALESVVKVCRENGLPLVAGDADSVERGALAAWTFDYKEHGRQAGALAVKILQGSRPGDLPVEQARNLSLILNETAAVAIQLSLPPDLRAQAAQVY